MKQARSWVNAVSFGIVLMAATWAAPRAHGQAAATQSYNTAEYNAFQAAHAAQDPAAKIKGLDDLTMKYPAGDLKDLMPFIYADYYVAYAQTKNFPKTIEYADKIIAMGDAIAAPSRLTALQYRAVAFASDSGDKALQTPEALKAAHDAAQQGLQVLMQIPKPAGLTDDAFATAKKTYLIPFNTVSGQTSLALKDYNAAADSFKAVLALAPMDAPTHYQLGLAYLGEMPAMSVDGFWELSRAIALKIPGDAQIRTFLRNRMLQYQQVSCDKLVDDEINDMVTVAAGTDTKPDTLKIPSADDLMKASADVADFIPWLMEGGDHAKTMWLATCGSQYPDVPVKVVEIVPGDGGNATLKAYRPSATDPDAAEKEMTAATTANMEIHITMQPDVTKLNKDDELRFTGTLSGYTQSPFLLTWDDAKVNDSDLKDLTAPAATPGARKGRAAATPKK